MITSKFTILIFIFFIIQSCLAEETGLKYSGSDNLSALNDQSGIFHIKDIESINQNPGEYMDKTLELTGIVSIVFSQKNLFSLSDTTSCPVCAAAKSSNKTIPVNFSGKLPEKKDMVRVYGILTKDAQNELLFKATILKKL
jgi:hypothetical protein